MDDLLRGKRILIVGRDYFFYTREIASELTSSFGAVVSFIPIEPAGLAYRLLKRIGLSAGWLERYHREALSKLQGRQFDVVLFIQVHQIGDGVGRYREAFPSARFVLYYWDSLDTHDFLPWVAHFDRVYTFDHRDCAREEGLDYLPLFYSERFRGLRARRNFVHDVSFVGTAVNVGRYEQLEKFRTWAKANGVSMFDYVVVSPILYLKMLLKGRVLRGVHFASLPENQLLSVYDSTLSVLDLPNNVQSGYTMRTFESLGAHRKLITTNPNVVNEAFYTPDSVFVLGVQGTFPDRSFFASPPHVSPEVERYSLRSWIRRLLAPVLLENRAARLAHADGQ